MLKNKLFIRKLVPFILSIVIIFSSSVISAPAQVADEIKFENEDSTFFLKNANIQSGIDDYYPETADINNEDAYNQQNMQINEISTFAATETVGDPMVYLTQKWLNQEYGDVEGFGTVTENGKTGWNVVYGLTRALQHELGITSLANNFGPTTARLYGENPLQRQDGVTNRKFAILQGALWCKGYNPGYYLTQDPETGVVSFQEIFDENVEDAIIELKEDAGFTNPDGIVTTNVMKALLTMDSFKLLSTYYGGKAEIRAMQQQFNRKYEAYTGLVPCDGVYGRNTNKALIYAIQAEEGLPVGTATGNFGPTTKSCIPEIPYSATGDAAKSYQGEYYNSAQIKSFIELMQFALFIHGFGDGDFDGKFDSATKLAVREFQSHYALPKTGIVDINTWMSLLISSGNPDRTAIAADCATILNEAKAKTLYDNGYRYIGRYLTGTYGGGISKALTVEEANIILDAGLRFFPIYQTSSNSESYFTPERGTYDAESAISASINLGLPKDTIIYFAVDFDAMDYQITDSIIPYFEKVYETVSGSGYKVGVYGARNVCSRVAKAGYSCSSFVGDMSTGFSGNLGFKIPDNWAFSQFANLEGDKALGTGDGRIEIDKNAFSGRDQGVGMLNKVVKKAIYVLPGYMGSKLFTEDNTQFWLEGTGMNLSLVDTDNIPLVKDIAKNALNRKSATAMLNSDGSGSKLHVDSSRDKYGALNTYEDLVKKLNNEFEGKYAIEFFPYNWLGDLNDSVLKLRRDIKSKGYTDIIFITHSTGGLLASAFIAENNRSEQKIKINKAILVAAPLFGTYASLAPIETGGGALMNEKFELVDKFATAVKTAQFNSAFPITLKQQLALLTGIYDAANNWVKDVTHNSPTTYQLLPSIEYIKLMPQLYEDEFKSGKAVTSKSEYYNILNQSKNINPNLTNGNNRSHQYFRDTVLNGDVVSVLQTVDTLLIASSSSKKKTPTYAKYTNKLFGGTKLSEIVYIGANKNNDNKVGDGTVHYWSATANDGTGEKLKVASYEGIGHTELVSNSNVLNKICNEIKSIETVETSTYNIERASMDVSLSINEMIKVNYNCDAPISALIYDAENNKIAEASNNEYFGFDGENFIYYAYDEQVETTDATIYIPNNGYKLIFKYTESENQAINFNAEISTLKEDGWKDTSVNKEVSKTSNNGIILTVDGTTEIIDNTNINTIINGVIQNHYTEWEVPQKLELTFGNSQIIPITGNQSATVSSLLNWSSSNEDIVTVSENGEITAIGYGKSTITAMDGNKISICEITVPQNATTVTIDNISLLVGEREPIKPMFYPTTATETKMTYTYDTAGVINIDEYGVIHAISSGVVTVTGKTEYGIYTSFIVTVIDSDFMIKFGDVNRNDTVDAVDLVRLKKYLVGITSLTGKGTKAADIDENEIVDAMDLLLLRKILLGEK